MAKDGGSRGPTIEQLKEYEIQVEERRRQREIEEKQGNDTLFRGNQNPPEEEESTFKFSIQDRGEYMDEEIKIKNIPPSVLPNFYGTTSEDPDSFLFEFDIVFRTYGYTDDAHRLRLFPTALKATTLRWFMGLGEHTVTDWDNMRKIFLKKYQPYYRSKDSKDDIFRMNQQGDETLEEYLERFSYNLQKSKDRTMSTDLI